jgi:hypothetical protein
MASIASVSDSDADISEDELSKASNTVSRKKVSLAQATLPSLQELGGSLQKDHKGSKIERDSLSGDSKVAVMVPGPSRPWEYQTFSAERVVDYIWGESANSEKNGGPVRFNIEYEDGRKADVSKTISLLTIHNHPLGKLH